MRYNKFKIGDKVIPTEKTYVNEYQDYSGLHNSAEWAEAKHREQGYLFINYIEEDCYVCCADLYLNDYEGDFFNESDLMLYSNS